jgi:hypothetical protein
LTATLKNRQVVAFGLVVGKDDATRCTRFTTQKPEQIREDLIIGVREATNAENASAIKATNSWPIFVNNIDWTGKDDAQMQVEFMCELMSPSSSEERAGRATQLAELFVADQVKSKMTPVLAKYKNSSASFRKQVAVWAKYYTISSRWEAFFLFLFHHLKDRADLSHDEKLGSQFMNMKTYDELRFSFVDKMPELGILAENEGMEAFNILRDAWSVPQPVSDARTPAQGKGAKKRKRAAAPKTDVKAAAAAKYAEARVHKGWYVNGVWKKEWKDNMWDDMSDKEQYDYRAGRPQGGKWSEQIPPELRCNPGNKLCSLTETCDLF